MDNIIAFHGFLGEREQWSPLAEHFELTAYDLYHESQHPLSHLIEKVQTNLQRNSQKRNIVIGYSLGGRLALEMAHHLDSSIDKLILLGAHPGIESGDERMAREKWLQEWREIIQNSSTKDFLNQWNQQKLFSNDAPVAGTERDREEILRLLNYFPLSDQRSFSEYITNNNHKITLGVGEHDERYRKLYAAYDYKNVHIFKSKGHRLLSPDVLTELIDIIKQE